MTLVPSNTFPLSNELIDLISKANKYEMTALAPNTRRTYASMWKKFVN